MSLSRGATRVSFISKPEIDLSAPECLHFIALANIIQDKYDPYWKSIKYIFSEKACYICDGKNFNNFILFFVFTNWRETQLKQQLCIHLHACRNTYVVGWRFIGRLLLFCPIFYILFMYSISRLDSVLYEYPILKITFILH